MLNVPRALVVKEAICPLLELVGDALGLLVSLKPGLVLLVESPALVLECFRSKILVGGILLVVEHIEQCVRIDPCVESGIVEDRQRFLGETRRHPGYGNIGSICSWEISIGGIRRSLLTGSHHSCCC